MATIDIRHPHRTTPADAAARTRRMLDGFRSERPELVNSVTWSADGTQGDAKGKGFTGSFSVVGDQIHVAIDLSFALKLLKGRIEDAMKRRLSEEFDG